MKTIPAIDNNFDAEDDAWRCADAIRPEIQAYLEYAAAKFKGNIDGASWALTWGFADLLRQFHGDLTMLERTIATYCEMTEDARTAALECQERVKSILVATRGKGFSTTALAWACWEPCRISPGRSSTRRYAIPGAPSAKPTNSRKI
jgi:hypothetical protein